MTSQELKSYAKAGAIAEEVFSSIRTIFSYNGGNYESRRSVIINESISSHQCVWRFNRYEKHLKSAKISGIRKGAFNGMLMGVIWFIVFCTYALVQWFSRQ